MAKNILIGTKVSEEVREKLTNISDSFGMSLYELIQALLCSLLHYFDSDSLITMEHNTLLNTLYDANFCHTDTFSPISLKENIRTFADKSILMISKQTTDKHNYERPQAILIKRNGENITESYNYDDMLKCFFLSVDPDILKALEEIKKEDNQFSILHILHEIVINSLKNKEDKITEEIKELFSDIRTPNGERINEDTYYKKRMNGSTVDNTTVYKTTRTRVDF